MARWFATFRKLQIGIGTSVAIFSRNPIYPTNPSHPGKNRDSSTGWTSNTTRLQKPPLLRRSCPLLAKSNTISTLARNRTAPPRRNRQAVKKSGIGFSPTPRETHFRVLLLCGSCVGVGVADRVGRRCGCRVLLGFVMLLGDLGRSLIAW